MPVLTETYDQVLKRQVRLFRHANREFRFPSLLAERFEPTEVLAYGGFGVLLVACDRRVFQRRVLIKAGLLEPHLLSVPNNAALPRALDENRRRAEHERKMLLHGQYRGASGIPVLIDWFDDVNPLVRGPHRDPDGRTFTNDDPSLWGAAPYLVLSYIDGMELDEHCRTSRVTKNPLGACRALGFYLSNTLDVFHGKEAFGPVELQFVYQDLKPANILVSRSEGTYCLIDFGSFAVIGPAGPSNAGVSTPGYAAPELQRQDLRSACRPRLDVYSLGVVLKECLQRAFGNLQPVPNIPAVQLSIPAPWQRFLDRCTAEDPEQRYQIMPDVIGALKKLES
jgi:serine/threonine protein kinase